MRIFVVGGDGRDRAAIEDALRFGDLEILGAAAPISSAPHQRRYAFAGWMLDATTRDLADPEGRRVNWTSSEFELSMAFVRQPGQPLSRAALLGVLRGRAWSYFRPLDRYAGGAAAQEDRRRTRPAAADPLRTRDRICVLRERLAP